MKRVIYLLVALAACVVSLCSCNWDNGYDRSSSKNPERVFAKVLQFRCDRYSELLFNIFMLDRYVSLDESARESFAGKYFNGRVVTYDVHTNHYMLFDGRTLILEAERVGEKSLFEGGGWSFNGVELTCIEGNRFRLVEPNDTEGTAGDEIIVKVDFCDDVEGQDGEWLEIEYVDSYRFTTFDDWQTYDIECDFNSVRYVMWLGYWNHDNRIMHLSGQAWMDVAGSKGTKMLVSVTFRDSGVSTEIPYLFVCTEPRD